ncbi:hypothetical protein GCM10011387_12000 [Pedobacter quisquiliarum]|uniref:Uncharacterized protein n=1 Tax=Pedobacter quisquiliarum TaxID=1834438 RepID=A0A916XBN1_9SPHI|nr:hypothetical protein GCM10011387_12000 [Pedobacter quisquiliarum]
MCDAAHPFAKRFDVQGHVFFNLGEVLDQHTHLVDEEETYGTNDNDQHEQAEDDGNGFRNFVSAEEAEEREQDQADEEGHQQWHDDVSADHQDGNYEH